MKVTCQMWITPQPHEGATNVKAGLDPSEAAKKIVNPSLNGPSAHRVQRRPWKKWMKIDTLRQLFEDGATAWAPEKGPIP